MDRAADTHRVGALTRLSCRRIGAESTQTSTRFSDMRKRRPQSLSPRDFSNLRRDLSTANLWCRLRHRRGLHHLPPELGFGEYFAI